MDIVEYWIKMSVLIETKTHLSKSMIVKSYQFYKNGLFFVCFFPKLEKKRPMTDINNKNKIIEFLIKNQVLSFGSYETNSGRVSPYFFNFSAGNSSAKRIHSECWITVKY